MVLSMPMNNRLVLITGGAGYIGSALAGHLLSQGIHVKIADHFMHGGDSILGYFRHPHFSWKNVDICQYDQIPKLLQNVDTVIHLAGISGFPACQALGREMSMKYNVEASLHLYQTACRQGVNRFIFPSTYTAFGNSSEAELISETSPPNPQTLYAETKIEAERQLQLNADPTCALTILRLADVYGISPRTRFDALVNQFVWQALSRREIVIYQRGYWRSFIHINDVIHGFWTVSQAPVEQIHNQIYNWGDNRENYSKEDVAHLIGKMIPGTRIYQKDMTFGGYRRDLRGNFNKISSELHITPRYQLPEGIIEIRDAIHMNIIREPGTDFHYNARFPVI